MLFQPRSQGFVRSSAIKRPQLLQTPTLSPGVEFHAARRKLGPLPHLPQAEDHLYTCRRLRPHCCILGAGRSLRPHTEAMFTLYRIGFCSVSKVAPVQCEQELMFCCGAEIVPKRSQCEQKPYPSCNLQRSLLI